MHRLKTNYTSHDSFSNTKYLQVSSFLVGWLFDGLSFNVDCWWIHKHLWCHCRPQKGGGEEEAQSYVSIKINLLFWHRDSFLIFYPRPSVQFHKLPFGSVCNYEKLQLAFPSRSSASPAFFMYVLGDESSLFIKYGLLLLCHDDECLITNIASDALRCCMLLCTPKYKLKRKSNSEKYLAQYIYQKL